MKILITGSHFTPAQAVIEELKKYHGATLIYIGRKHTMEGDKTLSQESQILPKLGVGFIPLTTGRLRRSFDLLTLWSLLKIPIGFVQALWIVAKEDPDVILSFGGYVAVPVVIAGWLLNKKIIIHEQTLVSGLANRITAFFADKIALSFDREYGFDRSKVVMTGNPMREELFVIRRAYAEIGEIFDMAKKEKVPLVFITGGNQGAHVINVAVLGALEELSRKAFIIHQTGESKFKDYEALLEKRQSLGNPKRYLAQKWVGDDFGEILRHSSLVVSRSGANTLTELAYFGVPTLSIPLPGLYKNEQMVNAKFFAQAGLGEVLPQSDLSPKSLKEKVTYMLKNEKPLREKAKGAKELIIPDAAKRLALESITLG